MIRCPYCKHEISLIRVAQTARQAEILEYYLDFSRRRGFHPSYMMIAREFGLKSKATVAKHMRALRQQGLLNIVDVG